MPRPASVAISGGIFSLATMKPCIAPKAAPVARPISTPSQTMPSPALAPPLWT